MARAKKEKDGQTATQRHAFYKRLVALGCVLCKGCNCYMAPEHQCQGDRLMRAPYTDETVYHMERHKVAQEVANVG